MKPSPELIATLEAKTRFKDGYPMPAAAAVSITVGELRWLIENLKFQLKKG